MKNQLQTYLLAGYSGLAILSSEEARAESEISSVCTSLKRKLHAWASTKGLVILALKLARRIYHRAKHHHHRNQSPCVV